MITKRQFLVGAGVALGVAFYPIDIFAERSFRYEAESRIARSRSRVKKWAEKGKVTVGIHGAYSNEAYKQPLEDVIEEIREEVTEKGIALPKIVLQYGENPKELDITVSHFIESAYRKELSQRTKEGTLQFINGHSTLELMWRLGATFVIDSDGHADSFTRGYNDTKFERVEVIFPYIQPVQFPDGFVPPSFADDVKSATCFDRDGKKLNELSDVQKLQCIVRSMMKHELYHTLGIIGHNENYDKPSVMTQSDFGRYRNFGQFERNALQRIYGKRR